MQKVMHGDAGGCWGHEATSKGTREPVTYTITFQPSGHTLQCPPDRAILSAALDSGLKLPFSCRSGVCRTCRGRLLEGAVDLGEVHPAYLDQADRDAGYAHLCQARAQSDCVIEIEEPDPAATFPTQELPGRVLAMKRLAPDVMALQVGTPANEAVRFNAGQYVDILAADGLRRSYSIANAPDATGVRRLEFHIRHMPGGRFTDRVFEGMQPRELLRMVVPQGLFYLREGSDKPIVFVCSGTGFAPIKSIVEYSLARGLRRPMHIYWGGRRRRDLYLDALPREWAERHPHIRYTPVLSEPTPECAWQGRHGFVHRAVLEDRPDLSGCQVYACGVPVMVDAARRDFTARAGLSEREFLSDAFVSEADRAAPGPAEMENA
jgi:CDP-4-dehydro-6-deoxyglucose reductase